jgi:hypothetical protein
MLVNSESERTGYGQEHDQTTRQYQKRCHSFSAGAAGENAAINEEDILNLKINLNIARDLTEFLEISG